jgi:S1-C subfamily serine protease
LRWNGKEVTGPASLSTQVARTEIGSTAKAVIFRDGREITVEVQVGQRPELP